MKKPHPYWCTLDLYFSIGLYARVMSDMLGKTFSDDTFKSRWVDYSDFEQIQTDKIGNQTTFEMHFFALSAQDWATGNRVSDLSSRFFSMQRSTNA